MSCARRLGCHALLRWRQRMLRADNTSVIVIALPEPGKQQLPMHRDEVILNLAEGPHFDPPGDSRADTPLIKVRTLHARVLRLAFIMASASQLYSELCLALWSLTHRGNFEVIRNKTVGCFCLTHQLGVGMGCCF